MKITIWSSKGGSTKTHISLCLWELLQKKTKKQFGVITNDVYTDLESKIPHKQLLKISVNEDIPIVEDNIIYDLGGYIDNRCLNTIKHSDIVIIPTIPSIIYLSSHLSSIKEVEKVNKNIIQVINRTKKNDFDEIKQFLEKNGIKYPCFEVKESKVISNIFEKGLTITKQLENGLFNPYSKKVIEQLNNIADFIVKKMKG